VQLLEVIFVAMLNDSIASTNNVKCTGREQDSADLYYYQSRYYKLSMGRFISEDPIGLGGGNNVYTYC
jgi:RHS repeat-associated protein